MRLPALALALLTLAPVALHAAPLRLSHSGFVLSGSDVPIDSPSIAFTFRIWSSGTATDTGSQMWPAAPAAAAACTLPVRSGYYAATLGDGTCGSGLDTTHLPSSGAGRWLEVTIAGTTLAPRLAIAPAPPASDSARIEGLSLGDLDARFAKLEDSATGALQAGHLRIAGTVVAGAFSGSGAGLTGIPASAISTAIADAQLASNGDLAKLSGAQTFTGTKTFADARGTFTGALLVPRGAAQPFACDAARSGALWFDTGAGVIKSCNGTSTAWEAAGAANTARPARLDATPIELDFDIVRASGVRRSITLRNDGDAPATSIAVTPPAGWTTAGSACPATLAAGSACTQGFEFTASGTTGARSGNASITSSAGTITVALTGTFAPLDGASSTTAATSCAQLRASYPAFASATYWLDPDGIGIGAAAFRAYCDLTAANDGGGWMLVASSASTDAAFAGGTGRNSPSYYLTAAGWNANPSPTADYIIGPDFSRFTFTEARLRLTVTNGYVLDAKWPVTSREAIVARANASFLSGSNVTDYGCGTMQYLVLDAVYADFRADSSFNANANQSTVGAAGVQGASGDPYSGTYWGHGLGEGSYEGIYTTKPGSCTTFDTQYYTTWIR